MLSGDGQRNLDVDLLEQYIEAFGDLTPIYYLAAKYCGDAAASQSAALAQVLDAIQDLPGLLAAAGVKVKKGRR